MPLLVLALSLQLVAPAANQRPELVHSGWQQPGAPLFDDVSLTLREIGSSLLISGGLLAVGQMGRLAPRDSQPTLPQLELGLAAVAPFLASWAVWGIEDTWRGRTSFGTALMFSVGLRVVVLGFALAVYLQTQPRQTPGTLLGFFGSDALLPGLIWGAVVGALGESLAVRVASGGRTPAVIPLGRIAF